MAHRQWRALGARTVSEARAFYMASFRRRMGVAAVREMARYRIRRVPFIGCTAQSLHAGRRARDAFQRSAAGRHSATRVRPEDFYAHQMWVHAGDVVVM